jgi:hypothetical protein
MDDRTSMLWARVMRGKSSRANAVTPVAAKARVASGTLSGSSIPTTVWARRKRGRSAAAVSAAVPKPRTCRITAASRSRSARETMRAPLSV